MPIEQQTQTRNIRIPEKLHERIKKFCKREGWLMGTYVAKILLSGHTEKENETSNKK
jgi:hypothetical protein